MTDWQDEIKRFWWKIQEQTKYSLNLIKQDRIRRGLAFDETFRVNFLRSANTKYKTIYFPNKKNELTSSLFYLNIDFSMLMMNFQRMNYASITF